jgi:hypothetical protein
MAWQLALQRLARYDEGHNAWRFTRGKEYDMTTPPSGNPFGAFMPGWDFLQNLGKAQSDVASPMAGWVAPTLNVEDLDKRIQELKAVQYWLEQNTRMLGATIQALEVQKMTLSTLKTMNVHADTLAQSLKLKPEDLMEKWRAQAAQGAPQPTPPEPQAEVSGEAPDDASDAAASTASDQPAGQSVDPVQWWGALSQQFQDIASTAAKDWQHHAEKAKANLDAVAQATAAAQPSAGSPAGRKRAKPAQRKPAQKAPAKKAVAKRSSATASRAKPRTR